MKKMTENNQIGNNQTEKKKQPKLAIIKKIREKLRQKQEKRRIRKGEQIEYTKAETERINFVGFALSRKFKYYKLKLACDIEKANVEVREIHGSMRMVFPDYKWLIANYEHIMDRACYFAFQEYQPVVHNLIDDYDFPNMHRSLVILPEKKAHFKTKQFSMFEFKRIVVYSEEPLEKDLTWLSNYKWKTEGGYDTTITFAPCSFLNIGSPLYDLPILVIKDALGKSNLFFQAKTTAEDLTKQKDELIRQQIFKMRDKEKNTESQIEELKMACDGHKKRYDNLKYTMLERAPYMEEEEFERFEKREAKKQLFDKRDYSNIIKWLLIGIFIILIIVFLVLIFTPRPTTITDVPEGAGIISNIYRGCI